jgi:hypothetical protein
LRILDEPRESQDETAFVEAAILHYVSHQAEQAQIATYVDEINHLREWGAQAQARINLLEAENRRLRARAFQQPLTTTPAQRRKSLYQVLVRHAPGRCPGNFGQADHGHDSQCPVHVVYSAQLGIEQARKAARDTRDWRDIMKCWITKDGIRLDTTVGLVKMMAPGYGTINRMDKLLTRRVLKRKNHFHIM